MKRASSLLVVFLFMTLAEAQLSLTIPATIESAVTKSEPTWKLVFVSIRKTGEENYSYFRWKRGADEIAIHVNEYQSALALRMPAGTATTEAFRKAEPVKGFGDEAYLLGPAQYLPKRFDIILRKGKVHVDIDAPSEELARQFAKHCARALPIG